MLSLKGVTLGGNSFGLSQDQRSFLCVTWWILGDGPWGHRKHTWMGLSGFCTSSIAWGLVASHLCVVCGFETAQWGCENKPTWCEQDHRSNASLHAGRWIHNFLGQRAWLGKWMCPMGLWMSSYNGLLSGSGFGYSRKIFPWTKILYVQHTHRWSDWWRVWASFLSDMPHWGCESLCKHEWYPIFYLQEQD